MYQIPFTTQTKMEQITIPYSTQPFVLPTLIGREAITNESTVKIISDKKVQNPFLNPQQNLEQTLNSIFPNSREENKLERARVILGEAAKDQTDEELKIFVTEIQYLIDTWLDIFEQEVFGGLTLKQLLKEI
jgi:hypothetical protein